MFTRTILWYSSDNENVTSHDKHVEHFLSATGLAFCALPENSSERLCEEEVAKRVN